MSAIKKWFADFYENYISINLNDYPNIGVNLEIVKILLISAVALCFVLCFMDYHKKNMYILVKQLMRHEARDEESAKTIEELGLGNNKAIKRALANSGQMKSLVAEVGEVKMSYEEYIAAEKQTKEERKAKRAEAKALRRDGIKEEKTVLEEKTETSRFYIKPEGAARASKIYNSAEISPLRTALLCVLTVAVTVCIVLVMPELLSWVNSIFE